MSDYLSRAAARASGTNPAIRPALLSRFEPEKSAAEITPAAQSFAESRSNIELERTAKASDQIASGVSEIQERVISILALAPETPAPNETRKPGIEQKSSDVATPKVRASASESESVPETVSSSKPFDLTPPLARSKPVAEQTGDSKESAPHLNVTRSGAETEVAVVTEARPIRRQKIVETSVEALSKQSGPVRPRVLEPSIEAPPKQSEPIRPKVIMPVGKDSSPAIPATALPRRSAANFGPAQARSRIRSANDESSAERTIQVTIGRLEVRAVQSAPGPSKPAPPKPRISLEEYLRSRNGEKR